MNRFSRFLSLFSALAVASCSANGENSSLVITKVLAPTPTVAGTPPVTSCAITPSATESSWLLINLRENIGAVGLVVDNRILLANPLNPNIVLNNNAGDFFPHQVVANYEVIGGGPTVPQQVLPAGAGDVIAGTQTPVGVALFPSGLFAGVPAGKFIRVTAHVEGRLAGGQSASTSAREYLFLTCATAGCAQNACL